MEVGMIGLGRMGANMAKRLLRGGHKIVAYNRSWDPVEEVVREGATGTRSLEELVGQLKGPRAVWLMLPAGQVTDSVIETLASLLQTGDTIIEGGNSNYKDTIRRARALAERGIEFVDVGTSGGVWGLAEGYSLMVGGNKDPVERLRPIFETLAPAPDRGWGHVGPHGAGHFVKMVHNGIEYGMMQALAEGFSVLEHKKELELDLHQISTIWQYGSVVRSWLLDLTSNALEDRQALDRIAPYVADSGEGRWTVAEAIDLNVPAPVITISLIQRLRSRDQDSFADRLLAAMRHQFGGHAMKLENPNG